MTPEDSQWQTEFRNNFERGYVHTSRELHEHACSIVARKSIRQAWVAISVSSFAVAGSISQEVSGNYETATLFGATTFALGAVSKLYSNRAEAARALALNPTTAPDIGLDNRGQL